MSPTNSSPMIRMNSAGNVLFYLGADGRLHQIFYLGSGWSSRIIATSAGPVSFSGPFDITPDCTWDDAQIYFQGPDGFVNVVFVSGSEWAQGSILCGPEPIDRECRDTSAYIRYANGMVIYEGLINATWEFDNFRAYYYGKCDADDV